MYFWSGASRAESHTLCPNDLLHWRAMCLAAELGLHRYNMSGHGRFKRKFGGVLTPVTRWHKCYSWPARVARSAYGLWSHESPRLYSRWIRATEVFTPDRTPVGDGGSANWAGPWPRPRDQRPALRLSDIWRAPLHDFPIRDEILYQYLPLTADTHVLEVGPGNGITAFHVARRVRHLTLLDVASGNVDRLKSALDLLPNVTFVCADICAPGLSDILPERFDAIYALEVFDLLPEPERCLANLAALLRPGGHLLLQFPNYPPSLSPGPTHYGSRQELGDALAAAGFTEWAIYALRLRPYAGALYSRLHELPLRLYRQHHARSARPKALVYDDSWAFQHGHRLERFKPAIHAAWSALAAAMRLGGDVFTQVPLGQDIMNRNLLLVARR
jgi:SAM-dependent methyltransferase